MEEVILGGGYTCSVCGQYQRTSALCHHYNNLIPEDVDINDTNMKQTAVEWFAESMYGKGEIEDYEEGYVDGYNQCQEDMTDKKYTEEDLRKAFKYGIEMEAGIESFDYKNYPDGFSQFINSLNKQD